MKYVLGISCFYHDAAACLLADGVIVAAAQEERFTRKKNDASFPSRAISYCLAEAGISAEDLAVVAFYDKPLAKFDRILEAHLSRAPRGFRAFLHAMHAWLNEKLFTRFVIARELGISADKIVFSEHHESHAASAFFPSPFDEAAFLTLDGVGEWATTVFGVGKANRITAMRELTFPHSLGLLYSAFTAYAGFKVNDGEYKLMGLAPYGAPTYKNTILSNLVDLKEDGSFKINMAYFNYAAGLTMTNGKFHALFGGDPRPYGTKPTQREMDLARSIQEVTGEIVLRQARHVHRETKQKYLCLAGGVALNCVANGRLLREGPFEDIWIQPAAGDAGGALGAAFVAWHRYLGASRAAGRTGDAMRGAYLGPKFSNDDVKAFLRSRGIPFEELSEANLPGRVAKLIAEENVVGWFQGRMEFGPRALGARSILGDARSPKMQTTLNLKTKFRESFRPFAPAVLAERVSDYFDIDRKSPYMLIVAPVASARRRAMSPEELKLFGIEKLNIVRSDIPAVTHVDYSARVETVHKETNPGFHALIAAFDRAYGCPVIINTSFNVNNEPIVCTPEDAYRCFLHTKMDYVVMGRCLVDKRNVAEKT